MSRRLLAPEPELLSTERALDGRGLTRIILIIAFVLVILAVVVPGGTVGGEIRGFLGLAFGLGSDIAPVVLGAYVTTALRSRLDPAFRAQRSQLVGWLVIFVGLDALFQAADAATKPSWGAARAGGWLGWLAWSTLVDAFGRSGAFLLVVTVALVGLTLVLDLTIQDVWLALQRAGVAIATRGRRLFDRSPDQSRRRDVGGDPSLGWQSSPSRDDGWTAPSSPLPATPRSAPATSPAWQLPAVTLLKTGSLGELSQSDVQKKIRLIEDTLADFDVYAKVVQVNPGPTITQFGLEPGFRERVDRNGQVVKREKIKVSEITSLQNDLALALAAPSIRIEAPVPGRQVVGLEVPNSQSALVSLRQVVESGAFVKQRLKTKLAVALGEDVSGQAIAADLTRMPHLLIAGATGSGKSICINAIISGLLLQATPDEVRLILVDPKRVELTTYNDAPHLLRPVVVDADKVVGVLKWVVHEMDERYRAFEKHGVRNVEGYNKAATAAAARRTAGSSDGPPALEPLPYIVVVIDELADLMMLAPDETERLICRLAQLARATGIHLIVATQRPSVDVITGLIKANFPTRISFAVSSQIDSRTILDMPGAEKLLGRGDMLYMPTDAMKPIRLQGVFVSDEEIEQLVDHWKSLGPPRYVDALINPSADGEGEEEVDELFDRAVELARETTRVSASFLQRRLRIGHNRAARLIDQLEERGILPGPENGHGGPDSLHDDGP
jgi:S-DNA-T family DNA segregation ATPase FtsK/SpoIIIE